MSKRWIKSTDKVHERSAESFLNFPDIVEDPEGTTSKWLEMAKIEPLWAKSWRYKPDWRIGPRVVGDSFWYFFEKGHGRLEIGPAGQRHIFQSGDMLLVPRGIPHAIISNSNREGRVTTVHFQLNLFPGISLLSLMGFPYLIKGSSSAPFSMASKKMAREFALKPVGWKQAMRGLIWEVLLYVARQRSRFFRRKYGEFAGKYLPRLMPALEWIENNFHEPAVTVGDLARQINVSEVYLRILFRRGLGTSPVAYVRLRRIEHACALLRATEMSVKEISAKSGFTREQFMVRVFCELIDATPSQYRANNIPGAMQI